MVGKDAADAVCSIFPSKNFTNFHLKLEMTFIDSGKYAFVDLSIPPTTESLRDLSLAIATGTSMTPLSHIFDQYKTDRAIRNLFRDTRKGVFYRLYRNTELIASRDEDMDDVDVFQKRTYRSLNDKADMEEEFKSTGSTQLTPHMIEEIVELVGQEHGSGLGKMTDRSLAYVTSFFSDDRFVLESVNKH